MAVMDNPCGWTKDAQHPEDIQQGVIHHSIKGY